MGKSHCREDLLKGICLAPRKAATLLALPGSPSEHRRRASVDHRLDIGIGSRLVQFMIESRDYVLPRSVKDRDSIGMPTAVIRIDADGVVEVLPADLD